MSDDESGQPHSPEETSSGSSEQDVVKLVGDHEPVKEFKGSRRPGDDERRFET